MRGVLLKATSILVIEVNRNKTQCDCFVTEHTREKRSDPKEVTEIRERMSLKKAVCP